MPSTVLGQPGLRQPTPADLERINRPIIHYIPPGSAVIQPGSEKDKHKAASASGQESDVRPLLMCLNPKP